MLSSLRMDPEKVANVDQMDKQKQKKKSRKPVLISCSHHTFSIIYEGRLNNGVIFYRFSKKRKRNLAKIQPKLRNYNPSCDNAIVYTDYGVVFLRKRMVKNNGSLYYIPFLYSSFYF